MLDKFKFLLFFILILVLILIIYIIHHEKDMQSFYENSELQLDFKGKKSVSDEKLAFMEKIIKASQYSNYKINKEREKLEKLNKVFMNTSSLSKFQKLTLKKLAFKYGIEVDLDDFDTRLLSELFDELSIRVMIVPVRLALAQAILESAWGKSRFAEKGNAYFGIHCYTDGCGMKFGSGKSKVFVKDYPDLQSSVDDYMLFLNSKRGTKNFRFSRQVYFESKNLDIILLSKGLDTYSEIGGNYQKIIRDLIRNYIPNEIKNY